MPLNLDLSEIFDPVVPFGKYRGDTLGEIADHDVRYLRWLRDDTDWGVDHEKQIDDALWRATQRRIEQAPPIILTDHQDEVAAKLLQSIEIGNCIVRLEGGAGCGKSFVTKKIAIELARLGYTSRAAAISYVATQVLAEQLDPYGVDCATVARTLKFKKEWIDGQEVYDHSLDTSEAAAEALSKNQALIIDECSMINDRDAKLLFDTVRRSRGLLVLIGDSAQLPPVKQDTKSICCGPIGHDNVAELLVPMRYAPDSPLAGIEKLARHQPARLLDAPLYGCDQAAFYDSMDDLMEEYLCNFEDDPAALHRMLLFRRADVVAANNTIRATLFGPEAEIVESDEQLMVLATTDTPYERNPEIKSGTRYYSGQTFRVLETRQGLYSIDIAGKTYEIPHWRVLFDNKAPSVRIVFGVTENQMDKDKLGGPEYQAALSAAREYGLAEDEHGNRLGDWEPWKKLQGDFLRVAYTYATSVHRAQGQTVDYAYCIPRQLLAVPGIMGRALIYVACTRAKKKLSVLR